ncbi:MAG: hypothetical protein E7231_18855 [Cellulosilyticum sp.]|nr:hypothetical protein [Cellulosilyticum sp.]
MAKTIKQIADNLGLDKQKVYRFIKKNHINEVHQKNGVMYFDEAVESLIKSHFSKITTSSEAHQITSNDAVIDVLVKQSEILKNELEIKNKQIDELNKRLKENQRLLDQQQQLQAIAENKIKLLEQKETPLEPFSGSTSVETKKGFFARLFRR